MAKYIKQTEPFRVPTTDGKIILEHFGLASISHGDFSIAHMQAPAGWSEPFQTPQFDEITIMVAGRKQVEIDGETVFLMPGESLLVKAGTRVRYSNPFPQTADYWSVCTPAFSLERVHREEG